MDKPTANKLRTSFNYGFFTALQDHAEENIKRLHRELETATDMDRVRFIQGQILELRRLIGLQDTINAVVKQEG